MDHLEERLERLEQRTHTVERQRRWWRCTTWLLLVLGLISWPLSGAKITAQVGAAALTLEQRVAALEAKLKYLTTRIDSSGRPLMEVAGANLRLVNGQGTTQTINGLGNLIVGYNEIRSSGNVRTGSHNVIVGKEQNYSSAGGLVVGLRNEINGDFAAVSGGGHNIASGDFSSISGGSNHIASGHLSTISGGESHKAEGTHSSIHGGVRNTTMEEAQWSSVSGGERNTARGFSTSVFGGSDNTASGEVATVCGGHNNTASGHIAAVSGGESNIASGVLSSVSGGQNRTAEGEFDWVAGSLVEDF